MRELIEFVLSLSEVDRGNLYALMDAPIDVVAPLAKSTQANEHQVQFGKYALQLWVLNRMDIEGTYEKIAQAIEQGNELIADTPVAERGEEIILNEEGEVEWGESGTCGKCGDSHDCDDGGPTREDIYPHL